MDLIAHPPEWLILEGVAYRRSTEHPPEPPWLHVNRAAGLSVHQQLQGAVEERDELAEQLEQAEARYYAMRDDRDRLQVLADALKRGQ